MMAGIDFRALAAQKRAENERKAREAAVAAPPVRPAAAVVAEKGLVETSANGTAVSAAVAPSHLPKCVLSNEKTAEVTELEINGVVFKIKDIDYEPAVNSGTQHVVSVSMTNKGCTTGDLGALRLTIASNGVDVVDANTNTVEPYIHTKLDVELAKSESRSRSCDVKPKPFAAKTWDVYPTNFATSKVYLHLELSAPKHEEIPGASSLAIAKTSVIAEIRELSDADVLRLQTPATPVVAPAVPAPVAAPTEIDYDKLATAILAKNGQMVGKLGNAMLAGVLSSRDKLDTLMEVMVATLVSIPNGMTALAQALVKLPVDALEPLATLTASKVTVPTAAEIAAHVTVPTPKVPTANEVAALVKTPTADEVATKLETKLKPAIKKAAEDAATKAVDEKLTAALGDEGVVGQKLKGIEGRLDTQDEQLGELTEAVSQEQAEHCIAELACVVDMDEFYAVGTELNDKYSDSFVQAVKMIADSEPSAEKLIKEANPKADLAAIKQWATDMLPQLSGDAGETTGS